MRSRSAGFGIVLFASVLCAQQAPRASYTVEAGTRIPLGLINSVSSKSSVAGDHVYLETVFPIVIDSHIVIPPGSYVAGTVTDVKRPGRAKGRGELFVRFDSLTLPNGVVREFRSRVGSIDPRGKEELDKKEGMIKGDSNKGADAGIIAGAATIGAPLGLAIGQGAMGGGLGAAAGAAAGLAVVLLTRGPDAVLAKGSTVEMVLDRPLIFDASEVNFTTAPNAGLLSNAPGPEPTARNGSLTGARRLPF